MLGLMLRPLVLGLPLLSCLRLGGGLLGGLWRRLPLRWGLRRFGRGDLPLRRLRGRRSRGLVLGFRLWMSVSRFPRMNRPMWRLVDGSLWPVLSVLPCSVPSWLVLLVLRWSGVGWSGGGWRGLFGVGIRIRIGVWGCGWLGCMR